MNEDKKMDISETNRQVAAAQVPAPASSPDAATQPNGKGIFATVIGKLARPEELLSLEGRASRGEYWATYLIVVVPLLVLCFLAYGLGYLSDYRQTHAICLSIVSSTVVLANIVFLPVMVRRVRDLALPPWVALILMVACALPYVKWLGMIAIIVLGCIDVKMGAGSTGNDQKLTPRMVYLYWLATVAMVSMGVGYLGYSLYASIDKRINDELKALERSSYRSYMY